MTLALTLTAAVGAGLILGLLGGGGSILTLPILVYLAGMPTREAIAASLFVVATTSAVALVPHARAGRVRWRVAAPFAAAGVAGAYAGGRVADLLPGTVLLVGFGLMMAAAAVSMLRPRRAVGAAVPRPPAVGRSAALGAAVGLVTGLVGAGGGFVIVPVFTLLAGLPMAEAVGTSLFVIAVQSTAGLLGHLHSARLDWPLVLAVTVAAIAGSLFGARLIGRVPQAALRTAFGVLVAAMAVLILVEQAPPLRHWLFRPPAGPAALAAAAVVAVGAAAVRIRARRRSARAAGHDDRRRSGAPTPVR